MLDSNLKTWIRLTGDVELEIIKIIHETPTNMIGGYTHEF
jgi:hypothetical protein